MALPRFPARPAVPAALAAAVAASLLAGCAGGPGPRVASGPGGRASSTPGTPGRTATTPAMPPPAPSSSRPEPPPSVLPVAPGAGSLPQTSASPSTHSVAFRHAAADLWLAVTAGRPRLALPAFFPLAAYDRLKAIGDPAADWHDRLWHDFALDVAAAHQLTGSTARLVRVIVASREAAWIGPGACYNRIGYWHSAPARVVYRSGGKLRSFGIASLISWRGEWYVVHLGAVLRNAAVGIVDQPTTGPGQPGPPGGC